MGRVIKYRGKTIDGAEQVIGDLINTNEGIYISVSAEAVNNYGDGTDLYSTEFYKVVPETVGQYTGLLDKNGVEICEGDIVKVVMVTDPYITTTSYGIDVVDGEVTEQVFLVEWDKSYANFDPFIIGIEESEIEVIGNIHDDPELLESNKC